MKEIIKEGGLRKLGEILGGGGDHMTAEETIKDFIKSDTEKMAEIIKQYPRQIPIHVISEWWGCDDDSVRRALEQSSVFGIGFRQAGKLNRGFVVPTGAFARWYLRIDA